MFMDIAAAVDAIAQVGTDRRAVREGRYGGPSGPALPAIKNIFLNPCSQS